MSGVLAAGLFLLAAAAAVDLAAGARWPGLMSVPYLLGAAGSGCLAAAGAGALAGQSARLAVSGWLGSGTLGLVADRLSGLFLLMSFVAATGVSLAFASWAARPGSVRRRGLGASYALALGAVAVIMTATDAFTALFAWETLTVAFYLLAGFERDRRGRPQGAFITLVFGRVSGAALLLGLLLLAARSHSLSLASFTHVPGGAARDAAEALLFAGFAVKVGLVPFQVWMPRGYPAAPGPARAIMAGVAVNVGFYGLWRSLELFGGAPAWLTGTLLVLAAMTALLGIAHAAVQQGLPRVIAYSSVENAGLILAGFGVALVGAAVHDRRLVAAGLLAATLQIVAHTAAKSLLFTSSAMIESQAGDRRPGRAARYGRAAAVERHRAGHRLADAGRAAADRRVRLRVVPARIADAAVPGARARLPAGPRAGRRGGRAHRRVRRGHLRPARRLRRPGLAPGPAGRRGPGSG